MSKSIPTYAPQPPAPKPSGPYEPDPAPGYTTGQPTPGYHPTGAK
jgi:hypothetical protein